MKALVIWAAVLLLLVMIGCLRVGIHFQMEQEEAVLKIVAGCFRISLPKQKKTEKRKRKSEEKPKQSEPQASPQADEKPKRSVQPWVQAALANWHELLALAGRVLRMPTLDVLVLRLTVGGEDVVDCSMNYGRICAAAGAVLPVLDNTFRIKKREVDIRCDFMQEKTTSQVRVDLTVRIYEILALAVAGLRLLLRIYREAKTIKKAVQTT